MLSDSRPSEVLLDFKTQRGVAAILTTTACFFNLLAIRYFLFCLLPAKLSLRFSFDFS